VGVDQNQDLAVAEAGGDQGGRQAGDQVDDGSHGPDAFWGSLMWVGAGRQGGGADLASSSFHP
jgi:hypothetical protein